MTSGASPEAVGTTQRSGPDISVVTVSYNCLADLECLVDSLRRDGSGKAIEVVVVDNCSTDGAVERVKERFPEVRVLQNTVNLGATKGFNRGLKASCGRYVTLMDADTMVHGNALGLCADYLDTHADAGVVAPRLEYPDGTPQMTARRFPRPVNALFGRHSFLSRLFPKSRFKEDYLRSVDLQRTAPYEVDWVSAACMMFRRNLIGELGGLDEGYWGYWVDADWCARVRKHGLKVVSLPSARVIHAEGYRPWKKKSRARIIGFHRGALRFYKQHCISSPRHPMALLAYLGLNLRCAVQLLANAFLRK